MAQPYQGIRISLNNTDINKVRNDFNSLVDELKKKAEQPINFKANIVGIKDSLKKESKNIDELIQAYEKLGNVKVKPLAYDNEGNLQKFKISIQQANGILEELTYKANKFEDVVGKLKPIGFELKGIKELDNSEKIITNLVEAQNKLYRELNNLQNEEFSIKQQLIKLDGQDKQLLEEKLNIIRQQQKSTGQLLNESNLKDTDKNNSILLERLKLTNDLTVSQEKYNKTLANQMANKRESGKTPSQQQAEDAKAQAQAYNKLLDSNYNAIVNFKNKQNIVLKSIKENYKNTFAIEEIIKFEQELDKLSPKAEDLQSDFNKLQKEITEFQNALKIRQYDNNLGEMVKTSTPFNFNADMGIIKSYVTELIGANAQITKIVPKTDQFGRNIKEVSVKTKDGANTWKNYNLVLNESQGTITKIDKGISNVGDKVVSLGDKMKSMMQGIALWAGGMTIFYGSIRKLQEGLEFINKINKSETNIQMIGGYSREQVQGLTQDYSKLADQLYTTTDSMMEGAEEFLRAGNTIEETQSLLKATTIGGAVSGQSSQEMAEQLIAISNGFKMATNDATQMMNVIDTLSTLDNNSATSMKEISTALMRTASSAQMAGVSFEELSSYIATVSSVTRRSSESIGESFKTIFARFQDVKGGKNFDADNEDLSNVERDLQKYAQIAIRSSKGTFKEFDTVLDELKKKWSSLSQVSQSAIAKALAGTRQRETFLVLMNNLDEVDSLQKEVTKSANSAQQKFDEAYGKSTEAKINKFKNSIQQLYMSMFNSQVINSAIADFTSVIQSLNTIVNSSENTKTAIIALTTTIVALGVAIKTNGIAELNKSLASLIPNLFKSAQSGTILTTVLGGLGKAFAFLISPVGVLSIALGVATIAMVKHINHQKELKRQADELKTSYDSLNKSIKDNDVNGMESSTSGLKKKQDEYKELLKQRKELEDRFKDISKSDMDGMEKTTAQNIISKQLSDTNKKIEEQANAWEEAGYTINKATGEVQQLNQAQTLLENNKIANSIREQSQAEIDNRNEIIKLIQEYQELDAIENKNAIQKERLSQLSEALTSKIGGLVVSKDKEGNVTIKNTDLLDKEIQMLNTEKTTVQTLTAVKLEHAKNNAVIEIGKTKTTYTEVKKRIEFYKEEMKALSDLTKGEMNDLAKKYQNGTITKDEMLKLNNMTNYVNYAGVRDSAGIDNLQKYIDEIDKIYASQSKGIDKVTDSLNNDYIPANKDATKSTKENTAAVNSAKNSIRDYENALKSLDNTIYKLEADMSGMDETSQTYRNALSQEIKLLEQKNKTLNDGITIAKNNASALGKMPKTTTTTSVTSSKGGVTASQLDNALGGVLKGHGADYIKYAQQYGVDPALAAAISISETGHGTSYAARVQNNPGGIMDWNNNWKTVKQFSSLEEGIKYQVKNLYDTYISKGLTSIESIGNKYAPVGAANDPNNLNKNWIPTVKEYYNKIAGGAYNSSSSSATSQNNVETEIDSLASKIEDYQKQKIDISKKIEELKIAMLESDTKFYDNQIANIDSKLNTSQTNADLYSDGSQQKTQYLTEQSKLINERYAVMAKKEQALNDAIKSGGYSEKVIADLKVQLADVKNEELSTIKELHDAFANMWDSELMSKTKIYDDNISTLQSKIDKLNVADKDNYEEKIKLNQKIIEQEDLKKQKIEEQIKKFREMLLVEKYDSTKDLLSAKINELLKQVDEVVQAQNDAKNNAVEMAQSAMDLISTVESKIAEMIKKDVDKQKESYDKDLDNFRSAIEEKKNLINNQYDEDNYNRQLTDENQKKLDIQSKINTLSLDSSDEAKAQVIELRKQLAEQQRVIDDKVAQHSKDAQIKALDDKLNAQEKAVSDAKEKLDEQYSDEEINMMARRALIDGYYTNIDGHIEKLKTAYINFENEFGEGMTSMGEIIETEFIEKIEKAIDLIGQTPELSNIIKGSSSNNSSNGNTSSKVIYGSGADLQNAKTYLSGYGYEFVDVSDGGKYKAGKNDIIVGGSAVTKNVSSNGATRLAGNDRDLTKEEIINLAKKLEKEGNSYKNGGIINNDQIALLHGSNANSSFEAVLNEPQLVNLTKSTILDTLKNVKLPSVLDNINLSQIKLPNLSSTNNASNVTLKFDKLINVEGNMDKGTVIDTQKIVNEVCTKLKTVINTNGGKRVLV